MKKLPPQTWRHDGQTFVVSLFVEGSVVVGMTPVQTDGGVVVPARGRGLGDRVAAVTGALGIPSCDGCRQRQSALNGFGATLNRLILPGRRRG